MSRTFKRNLFVTIISISIIYSIWYWIGLISQSFALENYFNQFLQSDSFVKRFFLGVVANDLLSFFAIFGLPIASFIPWCVLYYRKKENYGFLCFDDIAEYYPVPIVCLVISIILFVVFGLIAGWTSNSPILHKVGTVVFTSIVLGILIIPIMNVLVRKKYITFSILFSLALLSCLFISYCFIRSFWIGLLSLFAGLIIFIFIFATASDIADSTHAAKNRTYIPYQPPKIVKNNAGATKKEDTKVKEEEYPKERIWHHTQTKVISTPCSNVYQNMGIDSIDVDVDVIYEFENGYGRIITSKRVYKLYSMPYNNYEETVSHAEYRNSPKWVFESDFGSYGKFIG